MATAKHMIRTTTPKRRRFAAASLAVGAGLMAFGYFAPAANAVDDTNPIVITDDSNPKCAELGYPSEMKINSQPPAGDSSWDISETEEEGTVPADLQIDITNLVSGGGTVTFDWAATIADGDDDGTERDPFLIDTVIVKAAAGGHQWLYVPPVSSDTGLYSPKDSISHISFCWGPHETTDDGTTDDGTTDDGTTDDGTTDDGTTDDGTTDDGTTDDGTTDDGTTTDDVSATDSVNDDGTTDGTTSKPPVTVAGVTVVPRAQLPATGANDSSLLLIGGALILLGVASLVMSREVFIRS